MICMNLFKTKKTGSPKVRSPLFTTLLLLTVLFGNRNSVSAQQLAGSAGSLAVVNRSLILEQTSFPLNSEQQHYLDAWTKLNTTGPHIIAKLDPMILSNLNEFSLDLFTGDHFEISIDHREYHDNNYYSWFGNTSNTMGNANFVVNGDMITGCIRTIDATYLIYPITGGLHLLFKNLDNFYPKDESVEGYKNMNENALLKNKTPGGDYVNPEAGLEDPSRSGNCKVRVLVAYTNTAAGNMADIKAFVQSCIDASNTAYSNSSVYFSCELARSINEAYTESLNSVTDKTRLRATSDGYMDVVHDLRAYYDADLCVLVTEQLQSGICGEAWTVANAAYTDAFCVVTRGCAVGNLSFPHELGHLYGCRHDTYVDNTTTPYSYGHGYIYFSGHWRTVMAYNDYCVDNGSSCSRLQYFSNPAVTYNSVAMGTVATNDNESALESSVPNVSSLETTVGNKSFIAETVNSNNTADVISTTSITNSSTYTIQSGALVSWRTGSYHTLADGFWAKSGCEFSATFDNCTALRMPDPNPVTQDVTDNRGMGISIGPNPFYDQTTIFIDLAEDQQVSIDVYDLAGHLTTQLIDNASYSSGLHQFDWDANALAAGMYLIHIRAGNMVLVERIVKMN